MWYRQLAVTYLEEGRGEGVETSLKLLRVCSHVKLQEFQAAGRTSLLFVRVAGHMAAFTSLDSLWCRAEGKSLVF